MFQVLPNSSQFIIEHGTSFSFESLFQIVKDNQSNDDIVQMSLFVPFTVIIHQIKNKIFNKKCCQHQVHATSIVTASSSTFVNPMRTNAFTPTSSLYKSIQPLSTF